MNAIDEVQKQIDALQAQVDLLKQQSAEVGVKKWQPEGGDWYVDTNGEAFEMTSMDHAREFGVERATKEQAQRAAVEMRRFNRLLALRDELCGDDVTLDWLNIREKKCYVCFDHQWKRWVCGWCSNSEITVPYFPTEELAQKACDMLNSGEVEL